MKKYLLIFVLCIGWLFLAKSQDFLSWKLNDRYFSAQGGVGFSSYRGELKHNNSVQNEISNLNLALEARLLTKVSARVELSRYIIRGHDKHAPDSSYAKQRNLSFRSENWELSVMGIFYMRKYKGPYHKRWTIDPYLLAGFGTTFISPTAELAGEAFNLYQLETEGTSYSRFTMVFPVGAGLKFKVNPFLNFITEFSYRFTLSDYLDDVSGKYPENYSELDVTTQLLSNRKDEVDVVHQEAYDNLLVPGGPRGEPSDKDAYLFLNLKLEVFIPPGIFHGRKGAVVKKSSAF